MRLNQPELDVKLVVTEYANSFYREKLIAKILEAAGRTDVAIGVGVGSKGDGTKGRQAAWVKDYDLGKYPGVINQDGVQAMIDLINQSPRQITLLSLGPPRNLAEMLHRAPGIAGKVRFVAMLGKIDSEKDPKPRSEYNVKCAIKACQEVSAAPWSEMIITPSNTADGFGLKGEQYARVHDSSDKLAAALMENYRIWVNDDRRFEKMSSHVCDAVAVHLAYSTQFLKMEEIGIQVTNDGFTVVDPTARKVNVAMEWDSLPGFLDELSERVAGKTAK